MGNAPKSQRIRVRSTGRCSNEACTLPHFERLVDLDDGTTVEAFRARIQAQAAAFGLCKRCKTGRPIMEVSDVR